MISGSVARMIARYRELCKRRYLAPWEDAEKMRLERQLGPLVLEGMEG